MKILANTEKRIKKICDKQKLRGPKIYMFLEQQNIMQKYIRDVQIALITVRSQSSDRIDISTSDVLMHCYLYISGTLRETSKKILLWEQLFTESGYRQRYRSVSLECAQTIMYKSIVLKVQTKIERYDNTGDESSCWYDEYYSPEKLVIIPLEGNDVHVVR